MKTKKRKKRKKEKKRKRKTKKRKRNKERIKLGPKTVRLCYSYHHVVIANLKSFHNLLFQFHPFLRGQWKSTEILKILGPLLSPSFFAIKNVYYNTMTI